MGMIQSALNSAITGTAFLLQQTPAYQAKVERAKQSVTPKETAAMMSQKGVQSAATQIDAATQHRDNMKSYLEMIGNLNKRGDISNTLAKKLTYKVKQGGVTDGK